MSKPFFFRIESADLLNFATDPEGEGMSLLRFAKELQKGESEVVFIQSIIDEARNYVEKKKKAGQKGGQAKASSAKAVLSSAIANPSTPLARSSSSTEAVTVHKPKPLKKAEKISLPDFITESTWDEFKKMRVCLKKKMTPEAEKRMVSKLTKAHEAGHDVEKMLDQSILNSWSDVYEPKTSSPAKTSKVSKIMGVNC